MLTRIPPFLTLHLRPFARFCSRLRCRYRHDTRLLTTYRLFAYRAVCMQPLTAIPSCFSFHISFYFLDTHRTRSASGVIVYGVVLRPLSVPSIICSLMIFLHDIFTFPPCSCIRIPNITDVDATDNAPPLAVFHVSRSSHI